MPPTALSTYANCISAILELLKTLKKSRAELTRELFCRERNATTGTLFAFTATNTPDVSWESWNLWGDLKFSLKVQAPALAKQLNDRCQPIETRQQRVFHVISRQNIPLLRIQLCHVVRPLYLIFKVSFLRTLKKPEYINIHRTCCQSNFYLLCTCLFFCCSLSRNNNCLCVKEQYFSNSQVLSSRRWYEKVKKGPVTFLAAKSSGYSRVLSSDCFNI